MNTHYGFRNRIATCFLACLIFSVHGAAGQKRLADNKYVCSEPKPEAICNANNTCGSASTPCTVDIKRTADSAAVEPGIPDAKANVPFCVKSGTTMTWKSLSKNTGFVVD